MNRAASDPVTHWRGFTLSDFQERAVAAVRGGRNVLISAPTGAGKTLVAEYAIEDAVRRGKRCIYTAPIKALSNQKYRDFRDVPEVDVGLQTGDVTIHPEAQVLIMTTEILRNTIFENPAALHDVEYVVFDEIHFLDDPERGTVWEEALIFAPPSIRFICLSATIANITEIGDWIREIRTHDLEVIETDRRPVPLTHLLYHPKHGTIDPADLAGLRKRLGPLPKRGRGRNQRGRQGRSSQRGGHQRDLPQPEGLLDELQRQNLLPVLVFAFSRKDTERLARRNAQRDLLTRVEHRRFEALQAELIELFQLGPEALEREVMQMARQGIGYHHAGMLPIEKELVERMFTSGLLRMLFTTETFALGINMPARTVVFHSLQKYDGREVAYLRTRDYLQMAGRAGRQGIDTEGLVYSVLTDKALAEAPMQRILSGQPEAVTSRFNLSYATLLHLVRDLGRDRIPEAWEKSLNYRQHSDGRKKLRDRNQRVQSGLVEAHLNFLEDLGYIEGQDQLTARGKLASCINGYEVQTTELLFRGAMEDLPTEALCMIFCALIFEDRRRGASTFLPREMFGGVRRAVDTVLRRVTTREARFDIPEALKQADWGLTPAVLAWCEGASMDELTELCDVLAGDVCRTFRMAIQLMRQVRHAIDREWDLHHRLGLAMDALNRDEIDARRQLELG